MPQLFVRSMTQRRAGWRAAPAGSGGAGSPRRRLRAGCTTWPRARAAWSVAGKSKPLSRHKCWRCRARGAGRATTALSKTASASFMSVRFAALRTTPRGAPRRSSSRCRLVPSLPRLVGSGPVASPPRGGRHGCAVGRLPVPANPVRRVIAPQLFRPQAGPHALPRPRLEAGMHGRAGAELPRDGLPLAAGPQDMQDAVEHSPKRHGGAPAGAGRLLRGQ